MVSQVYTSAGLPYGALAEEGASRFWAWGSRMARNLNDALWRFDTARLTVALFAEEEDMEPRDGFCDERDVAFASDGDPAHWFAATVVVFDEDGTELAADYLGGCSYNSFGEFYSGHRDRNPLDRNCSLMRARRGQNVA